MRRQGRAILGRRYAAVLPRIVTASLISGVVALAGCWTAPVANVQPKGPARLIQDAISVDPIKYVAVVDSVDPGLRTITVRRVADSAPFTLHVAPRVGDLGHIMAGQRIRVTVTVDISVYVLRDEPGSGGLPGLIKPDARVRSVDAGYRLLTVQFPNGGTQILKLSLSARLDQMAPGDGVVIRPIEAIDVRVR